MSAEVQAQAVAGYQLEVNDVFSWEEYLKEHGGTPADPSCFCQAPSPHVNLFEVGTKIEAVDPRNPSSKCLASIVGKQGPRIRLRLDGSDDGNDFWRLVDSADIQPRGRSDKDGVPLQPPLGFRTDSAYFSNFLKKALSTAKIAPEECFKPAPPRPTRNMFEVGNKMEAVDLKNPHLICPATVEAVDGDNIRVAFDGWRGAFDYSCPFYSRDIFPVGWCQMANHPIQPPGVRSVQPGSVKSSKSKSSSPSQPLLIQTANLSGSERASPALVAPSPKGSIPENPNSPALEPDSRKRKRSRRSKPKLEPEDNNEAVAAAEEPPPKEKKLEEISKVTVSDADSSMQDGNEVPTVTVFVNKVKARSPLLNPAYLHSLPMQFGPGPIPRILREVVQTLIDCAVRPKPVFDVIPSGDGPVVVSMSYYNKVHSMRLPNLPTVADFWKFLHDLLNDLQCSGIFYNSYQELNNNEPADSDLRHQSPGDSCGDSCSDSAKLFVPVSITKLFNSPLQTCNDLSIPADPRSWTIDDVVLYLKESDSGLEPYADLFRTHEIDGRAFMLLTSDLMMKYMQLKLGPTVKVTHLISRLKKS